MLNEYLEFEAYTSKPESDTPRLMPNLLSNKFQIGIEKYNYKLNGIDEIMTIIARNFLFPKCEKIKYPVNDMIEKETLEAARTILRAWCGFKTIEVKSQPEDVRNWFRKYPDANGWLKKYWIHQYNLKKKITQEEANMKWEEGSNAWEEKLSSGDYRAETYSYNNIIANAIECGPLKERYCVFKKKDGVKFFEYPQNIKSPSIYKMLKNIIAFCIFQEEHPQSSQEVLLKKIRLFGWYNTDDTSGNTERWCLRDFCWDNKEIMYRIEGMDYAKYGIDENYRNAFGIKLIKSEEKDNYLKDYWVIKDNGHNELLEIINDDKI